MKIVLASGSPRRRELMEMLGVECEVRPSGAEEVVTSAEPEKVVEELSRLKCLDVAELTEGDSVVIGADTVVAYENQILGKPKDEEDARRMLTMLSGKTHSVYTGVTFVFIDKEGRTGEHCFFEKTDVCMYPLEEEEIDRYIQGSERIRRFVGKHFRESRFFGIRRQTCRRKNVAQMPQRNGRC